MANEITPATTGAAVADRWAQVAEHIGAPDTPDSTGAMPGDAQGITEGGCVIPRPWPDPIPLPEPTPGCPGHDHDIDNLDARQQIRQAFVDVAKDGRGVGSDAKERQVDQMLFDMLPKIDFSKPGGAKYAQEISDFLHTMGRKFSDGEIQHLKGLLDEAATALPAEAKVEPQPQPTPTPEPAPAPEPAPPTSGDDLVKKLLELLQKLLDGGQNGQLDGAQRDDLLKQLTALLQQLAGDDASAQGAGQGGAAQPGGGAEGSGGAQQGGGSEHAGHGEQSQGAGNAQGGGGNSGSGGTEQTQGAGQSNNASHGTECCHHGEETSGSEGTQGADDANASQNNNGVLIGVLRLLVDMLGANEDGKIDKQEQTQLLKDVVGLMQKLLEGSGNTQGSNGSGSSQGGGSAPSADATRPGNQLHDSQWFFDKLGLSSYLSGYFGAGNTALTDMVRETLKNTDSYGIASTRNN